MYMLFHIFSTQFTPFGKVTLSFLKNSSFQEGRALWTQHLFWIIFIFRFHPFSSAICLCFALFITGNSISSLHCPNSESDTLKSSRSTSSTHTGGNSAEHSADHSTLQTYHQQATCQDSLMDSECPPDTIERIHRFPNLQGTPPPPPTLRRAYLRVDPNSTAGDRYHGSQPPGTWDTDTGKDTVFVPGIYFVSQLLVIFLSILHT